MTRRKASTQSAAQQGLRVPAPDALLCALTLQPTSFSRNRYFWLYTAWRTRAIHKRAHVLRRLAEQLGQTIGQVQVSVEHDVHGVRMAIRNEALSLERRLSMTELELSLLRYLLARWAVEVPPQLELDRGDLEGLRAATGNLELGLDEGLVRDGSRA